MSHDLTTQATLLHPGVDNWVVVFSLASIVAWRLGGLVGVALHVVLHTCV